MAFYHCPYIFRIRKICNRGSYRPERSTFIGNLWYVLLVEIDCDKLTTKVKRIITEDKINLLENSTFDMYAQFCARAKIKK